VQDAREADVQSGQPSTNCWRNIAKSLSDPVMRKSAHVVSLLEMTKDHIINVRADGEGSSGARR